MVALYNLYTMQNEFDFLFKIVLAGNCGTGKTNIISRFTKNEFQEESRPTIGAQFSLKLFKSRMRTTKLQIWEFQGGQRYRQIHKSYYRKATGILFVYDITNRQSFENLRFWVAQAKQCSNWEINQTSKTRGRQSLRKANNLLTLKEQSSCKLQQKMLLTQKKLFFTWQLNQNQNKCRRTKWKLRFIPNLKNDSSQFYLNDILILRQGQ